LGGVSRRMGGHGGPCPSLGITKSKAAEPIRQVGRDGVPAVRKNIGRRGLRPSRRAFAGPIFLVAGGGDSPGRPELPHERARGTVPLPGIAKSKAAQPIRQVGRERVLAVRENSGRRGLRPSHKVEWEGRRPCRPQEYWAQRTVPLPGHRQTEGVLGGWPILGGTVCLRCAFGGRGGVCRLRAGWPGLGGDRACGWRENPLAIGRGGFYITVPWVLSRGSSRNGDPSRPGVTTQVGQG